MERRKFIAGLGSLTAAGAAGIGTGAFTTASADRTVNVNVASDSSGFVEITAQNSTYASGTSDGQLEINFNGDNLGIFPGDAEGLNPGSTFNFDDVFRIANISGTGDMRVVIEASGFDLENLELTADGGEAISIASGTSLRAKDYSDVDNLPKLVQPDAVDVEMEVETKKDMTGSAGGTLTIYAATGGNRDKLSDVL
jgi:hypothetical protein